MAGYFAPGEGKPKQAQYFNNRGWRGFLFAAGDYSRPWLQWFPFTG
jgi:hypothetical protein